MNELLYTGIDFVSAVGQSSLISGLLFFLKLLIVLVSLGLVVAIVYVIRAGNFIGIRRRELSWYLEEGVHAPQETPSAERQDELYVSWQYLYDRLNEENVDPREVVLQGEQLFLKALEASGIPGESAAEKITRLSLPTDEVRETQGQIALLKRNDQILLSPDEARRMLQVYEQTLKSAGAFPSA